MRIRRRWLLVALLAAVQFACLAVGLAWFSSWLRAGLTEQVARQSLDDTTRASAPISRLLVESSPQSLERGSAEWERLQSAVEVTRLPGEGYACIVDDAGHVVCHPGLRAADEAGLCTEYTRLQEDSGRRVLRAAVRGHGASTRDASFLTITSVPRLGAHLVVRAPSGIPPQLRDTLRVALNVGCFVGLTLVVLTILAVSAIVQRYDNRLFQMNQQLEAEIGRRTQSLVRTRNSVIFGLAKLSESRDNDTGDHLERIGIYTRLLSEELAREHPEIDGDFRQHIALASSLHDIGKVGIPDAVLLKPGRLTPEERRIIQQHAAIGGDCLAAIREQLGEDDFLELAMVIAYCHHEWWNGGGYPFGLSGDDIPLAARIVALADVYDALTTRRPYKEPFTHEQACDLIIEGCGTQFDPRIVEAFLRRDAEFRETAQAMQPEAGVGRYQQLRAAIQETSTTPAPAAPSAETRSSSAEPTPVCFDPPTLPFDSSLSSVG